MGNRSENEEAAVMRCHVCGATMEAIVTTLPLKVRDRTIVIIKSVPVRQCVRCSEYLLEDAVMVQVDSILAHVNATAELEVIEFAT
jgi:YgiT-type zinc finger domain-containing protein